MDMRLQNTCGHRKEGEEKLLCLDCNNMEVCFSCALSQHLGHNVNTFGSKLLKNCQQCKSFLKLLKEKIKEVEFQTQSAQNHYQELVKHCDNFLARILDIFQVNIIFPLLKKQEEILKKFEKNSHYTKEAYKRIHNRISQISEEYERAFYTKHVEILYNQKLMNEINTLQKVVDLKPKILYNPKFFLNKNFQLKALDSVLCLSKKYVKDVQAKDPKSQIYNININTCQIYDILKGENKINNISPLITFPISSISYVQYREKVVVTHELKVADLINISAFPLPIRAVMLSNALVNFMDKTLYSLGVNVNNSECYKMTDLGLNKWKKIPSLHLKRFNYYGVLLDHKIYCFGGDTKEKTQYYEIFDVYEEEEGWAVASFYLTQEIGNCSPAIFPQAFDTIIILNKNSSKFLKTTLHPEYVKNLHFPMFLEDRRRHDPLTIYNHRCYVLCSNILYSSPLIAIRSK